MGSNDPSRGIGRLEERVALPALGPGPATAVSRTRHSSPHSPSAVSSQLFTEIHHGDSQAVDQALPEADIHVRGDLPTRPPELPTAAPAAVVGGSSGRVPSIVRGSGSTATRATSSQDRKRGPPSVSPPPQASNRLRTGSPPHTSAGATNPPAGAGNPPSGPAHGTSLSTPADVVVLPSFQTLLSSLPPTARSPPPGVPAQATRQPIPVQRAAQQLLPAPSAHYAQLQSAGVTSNTSRRAVRAATMPARPDSPPSEMEESYVDGVFVHMRHPDQGPHPFAQHPASSVGPAVTAHPAARRAVSYAGAAPAHASPANAQQSSSSAPPREVGSVSRAVPVGGPTYRKSIGTICVYPGCGPGPATTLTVGIDQRKKAREHCATAHFGRATVEPSLVDPYLREVTLITKHY